MAVFSQRENKTGKVWEARIRLKGHRPRKKTFPTKAAAKAWATEYESILRGMDAGDPAVADKIKLLEALHKFQKEGRENGKKETTLKIEATATRNIIRLLGNECTLSDVNGPLLSRYILRRKKEGVSPGTIRIELSVLSRMYKHAIKIWGIRLLNPTDYVKWPKTPKASERFLATEEAEVVLEIAGQCKNKKFRAFVLLLLHTGARSGEIARLHPDSVDFAKKFIRIQKTKTDTPRTVPLTAIAVEALAQLPLTDAGYYFLNKKNLASKSCQQKPANIWETCWRGFWKRMNRSHPDFKHFRVHDLRHTAASHLLMEGVDVRVVADLLGHSNISMTMRYTHLIDDYRQNVVEKISHLGQIKK